jgi:hypothetical protein
MTWALGCRYLGSVDLRIQQLILDETPQLGDLDLLSTHFLDQLGDRRNPFAPSPARPDGWLESY